MTTFWAERGVHLGVLLGTLGGSAGCGATGLAWVRESPAQVPVSDIGRSSDLDRPVATVRADTGSIPAETEQERQADARPRLSHSVTLGEVYVPSPGAAPASAPAGVSVTVNNYNAPSAYGPGVAAFFAGRGAARPGYGSVSGPQAGQSWPAIVDHGPSFPYRSPPASPWSRGQ
jgi:hypothetical protein